MTEQINKYIDKQTNYLS